MVDGQGGKGRNEELAVKHVALEARLSVCSFQASEADDL